MLSIDLDHYFVCPLYHMMAGSVTPCCLGRVYSTAHCAMSGNKGTLVPACISGPKLVDALNCLLLPCWEGEVQTTPLHQRSKGR